MKIDVILSSNPNSFVSKDEFDLFSGHAAGVCYMPGSFENLINEKIEKTYRRIDQTKSGGHHSVYDHETISFYLEDIPKAVAMILNNEKMYTTSEKSARYTKMVISEKEQLLFDKWNEILIKEITDKYKEKNPDFFKDSRIVKLAQENARYLTSIFTPTSMIYTCSYRQINIIYSLFQREINNDNPNKLFKLLKPAMIDFCKAIEKSVPYLDDKLQLNEKNRKLSLITDSSYIEQFFGDVYSTSYKGSFAQLAQAQRHRTINYSINLLDTNEYYVPPIIARNPELKQMWLNDCKALSDKIPQGTLVQINELGTLDNFILKMKERKCAYAQLEIMQQTNELLEQYISELDSKHHPRAAELKQYSHGSRCTFPDYKCTNCCGFKDGITENRII